MSVKIIHRVICDFCGENLEDQSFVYINSPEFIAPVPTQVYAFRLGGSPVDLCGACANPIWQAKDARIKELRDAGKLTGYPEA